MYTVLETVNACVWGVPTLLLITGVGIWLTLSSNFVQFRLLPAACKRLLHCNTGTAAVSSRRALCTALAATVGTGNMAGVAGAIAIGGPGAVLWMWICGMLGMAIKFAEATLASRYRVQNADGELAGGPMYMIDLGMPKKWKPLACAYSFFGILASFGVGNATQINAVTVCANSMLCAMGRQPSWISNAIMGVCLSVLVLLALSKGAKSIGAVAVRLVPAASFCYIMLCLWVLCIQVQMLPDAFAAILRGAFAPNAITGGVVGSVFMVIRIGASRGIFTNEAGMGTAAIAHAGADVSHPVEQGLMGILEVFLDTIVICTLTALVILCSGVSIPYGTDTGMALTAAAFSSVCGDWVQFPLGICIVCFALSTVLGWSLYGARCGEYLFGESKWKGFALTQALIAFLSACTNTGVVWVLAEIVNGLMAIPNLIALWYLTPELLNMIKNYNSRCGNAAAEGDRYENFNQCKSL